MATLKSIEIVFTEDDVKSDDNDNDGNDGNDDNDNIKIHDVDSDSDLTPKSEIDMVAAEFELWCRQHKIYCRRRSYNHGWTFDQENLHYEDFLINTSNFPIPLFFHLRNNLPEGSTISLRDEDLNEYYDYVEIIYVPEIENCLQTIAKVGNKNIKQVKHRFFGSDCWPDFDSPYIESYKSLDQSALKSIVDDSNRLIVVVAQDDYDGPKYLATRLGLSFNIEFKAFTEHQNEIKKFLAACFSN